jgi:hypothetical protein
MGKVPLVERPRGEEAKREARQGGTESNHTSCGDIVLITKRLETGIALLKLVGASKSPGPSKGSALSRAVLVPLL